MKFNALNALLEISGVLENSQMEILGLYSEKLYSEKLRKIQKNENELKLNSDDERLHLMEQVQKLGKFLKTTPLETLLFVSVFSLDVCNSRRRIDGGDIAVFIGINKIDIMLLRPYLQNLQRKGLVPSEYFGVFNEENFSISPVIKQALIDNKPIKKKKNNDMNRYKFCEKVSDLIEKRSDGEISTAELFHIIDQFESLNLHLNFIVEVIKLLPEIDNRILYYRACYEFISRSRCPSIQVEDVLNDIYDDMRLRFISAKSIMKKESPLIVYELVELLPARFLAEAELALTEKGKRLFLENDFELFCSDGDLANAKGGSDSRLLSPEKIPARELFFSDELSRNIEFVKNSLMEDSLTELQKRLEQNAMPKGLAMLFHGLPGTGKTAAVDMIAKATGRAIYHVDIAASKTCWFGESEKLFKKIFTDYRRMCETEKLKPILLFNEADALFGKRRDVTSSNVAQTENTLQNILLEELETLDGILIATTNLCENFDSAFERRFLFKVQFDKPNVAAKSAIWKSKLSWLSDEDCNFLAKKYDLSGGEIDNIVRKSIMEEVLSGKRPDVKMLENWCSGEKLSVKKGNAIGFSC